MGLEIFGPIAATNFGGQIHNFMKFEGVLQFLKNWGVTI